jgi:hypothetical protein
MKKLEFIEEKEYQTLQLPNGKLVDVRYFRYNCKVDLENETCISFDEVEEYNTSNLPTFNELVKQGIVNEVSCVENFAINQVYKNRPKVGLTDKKITSLINKFKKNGFNVTKDAILHNYNAWLCDRKSGYRDDENEYFLFSPCGCNPLSFRATTLHTKCYDWQQTYTC